MRRTVKITNKTDFDTRNLRSLVLAVARRELKATQYPNINVTVGYPKRKFCTSLAVVNPTGTTAIFTIYIPKDQVDVVEVCHRIKVCFDYCLGRHGTTHSSFRDWYQRPGKATDYPFAKKYTMAKEQPKVAKKLTGAASAMKKAEHAQEKVHYWERKVKYATTMLKKWQRQLRRQASRGEKLHAEEATNLEQRQGMTVEEFLKMPPVGEAE